METQLRSLGSQGGPGGSGRLPLYSPRVAKTPHQLRSARPRESRLTAGQPTESRKHPSQHGGRRPRPFTHPPKKFVACINSSPGAGVPQDKMGEGKCVCVCAEGNSSFTLWPPEYNPVAESELTEVGELHSLTDWQVSEASDDAELEDFWQAPSWVSSSSKTDKQRGREEAVREAGSGSRDRVQLDRTRHRQK